MRITRTIWRTLVALTLLLGLGAGIAPAPAAAQSGMGTLEIHSRFCPPNYAGSDLFNDCHGNPGIQGIQFGIAGGRSGSGTPNAEGNLTFDNLPAGEYRITSTAPSDKQLKPAVYCSPGDGSTASQAPSTNDYQPSATIQIAAGQSLICDWYTIPTADFNTTHSNLTIHNRFCPMGYAGSNFFQDCHDNVGVAYVSYTMDGPDFATAMLDVGDATFTWLAAGDYNLSSDLSLPARLICSAFDHAGTPFLDVSVPNGGPVGLELNPGMSVVCDWFVTPTPAFYEARGSIDVVAARCESAQTISLASGIIPDGCVLLSGITVSVYPYLTGPGEFGDSCTTNGDGICRVEVRHQVPLNVSVADGNWPAGYTLEFNPFYAPPQYTEFAQVSVVFIPE
jgi:hypothetical protein